MIKIDGQIGAIGQDPGVELADVIAQVRKQPDATSFRVYINSEGGRVDTGFDIYNYLRSLGVPITTIGNGLVASIATVVFMAGDKRVVREGTQFMIHLPMGTTATGTADEIEAYAKAVKKVERKIVKFYQDKFQMGAEIEPLLREETWLSENQLKDLEITTMDPINISAKADIGLEKNETKNQKPKEMSVKKKSERSILQQFSESINKILNGAEITNKVLLDANLREVVFAEVAEEASVEVGDVATIEGQNASGEVLMQDGRTFVFGDAGALTEIREAGDNDQDQDQDQDELATIRQELANMKAERDAVMVERDRLRNELTEVKKKASAQTAILNRIKSLETEVDLDQRRAQGSSRRKAGEVSRASSAIAGLRRK